MSLERNAANFAPLTPVSFLTRAAKVYPDKIAVIHGEWRYTYAEFYDRCARLAEGLAEIGVKPRDTVAVMAPNIPPLLEAHYGVPMAGAILCALNTKLDARSLATFLAHSEAKVLIIDRVFLAVAIDALKHLDKHPLIIEIADEDRGESTLGPEYENILSMARLHVEPSDEWEPIALNYTSGTSGDPRGVVYHHRGAYLNAMSNAMLFLNAQPVYLWTLPMFHCNGWTFTWAVTLVAGTHVCLRQANPSAIFNAINDHQVTHLCAAPIVLNLLANARGPGIDARLGPVQIATGGAAPPPAIIAAAQNRGFNVTHLYGLTESFGPSAVCAWQEAWLDLTDEECAALMARQGVPNMVPTAIRVVDPETMQDVPADGRTMGEMVLRGNTVMAGYLKAPEATEAAFKDGWFHTGDLAVMHSDGYVEIKDRSKDIILVGGDNVSSLEIEEVLYSHPGVLEAAVVAKPDPLWGEIPVAFVTLKDEARYLSKGDILAWCDITLATYKVPRDVVWIESLPKTATGKIQKFELRESLKR